MSLNDVLKADWDLIRPREVMPSIFSSAAPMWILDYALQSGPIDIMPLSAAFGPMAMQWAGPVPAEPQRPPPVPAAAPSSSSGTLVPKIAASSTRVTPSAEDAADQEKALRNWGAIISKMGDAFGCFMQLKGDTSPAAIEVLFTNKGPSEEGPSDDDGFGDSNGIDQEDI